MHTLEWRSVVTDPREIKIFEALEDTRWRWRTVGALARESGMSPEDVRRVLNRYHLLVRRSLYPGPGGEDLYTLQSRYLEEKSPIQKGWDFLSTSSGSTT